MAEAGLARVDGGDVDTSPTLAELAKALCKAQGKMKHAIKDANNPFFHSKYADLASVVEASRPSLTENGLSVVQFTKGNFLHTMLLHESGEWVRGSIELKPMRQVKDTGWAASEDPQSYGSCITYARRYAMAAITGVATEDDDGNAASGNKVYAKKAAPASASPAPSSPKAELSLATGAAAGEPENKGDATLRHELQELAAVAEEAQLFGSVTDAIYYATSYTTKDGKEAGYKDVVKLKSWQMSKAIAKLSAKLNEKPSSLDAPVDDDIAT